MRRSEIFFIQKFAAGRGVECDSDEAAMFLHAKALLANPATPAETREHARKAVLGFNNWMSTGKQVSEFDSLLLPEDEAPIDEDVDESRLDEADRTLLHLPLMTRAEFARRTKEGAWRKVTP